MPQADEMRMADPKSGNDVSLNLEERHREGIYQDGSSPVQISDEELRCSNKHCVVFARLAASKVRRKKQIRREKSSITLRKKAALRVEFARRGFVPKLSGIL